MEEDDDRHSSADSFSVVDDSDENTNHRPRDDPLKEKDHQEGNALQLTPLKEPSIEEISRVTHKDSVVRIFTDSPRKPVHRFFFEPNVQLDPKTIKSESKDLCFKIKMWDPEIRVTVLDRLRLLPSLKNVEIRLDDIYVMPYEEVKLIVKTGSVLKSIKQNEEPIAYYVQLKESLDFHLQCEYSSVAAELVGDFKKNPEFVIKKWMLALECKGVALGTGSKPLEVMSATKKRPTWIFPVHTFPCDFDLEARTQALINTLPPRLNGYDVLVDKLQNEIKGLKTKLQEAEQMFDATDIRIEFLEKQLQEAKDIFSESDADAQEKELIVAKNIKDLQTELQKIKSASSATDDKTRELQTELLTTKNLSCVTSSRTLDLQEKVQVLTSSYQSDIVPKQNRQEQQILEMEENVITLTNKKIPSAIPIFSVRTCINPYATASLSFGYTTHDFDVKAEHVQIDLPTGIVTILKSGIYQLIFNSTIQISTSYPTHRYELRVDGVAKASSFSQTASEIGGYEPIVISALLQLNSDQKVGVFAVSNARLYESGPAQAVTRFSGTLFSDQ